MTSKSFLGQPTAAITESRYGRDVWDFVVRSYGMRKAQKTPAGELPAGEVLMMETVHRGEDSMRMEVEAAHRCNRRVEVYDLRSHAWIILEPRLSPDTPPEGPINRGIIRSEPHRSRHVSPFPEDGR